MRRLRSPPPNPQSRSAPPEVEWFATRFEAALAQVHDSVQGKESLFRILLAALTTGGHILLEDLPGTGKSAVASALGALVQGSVRQISMTPDLLPSDLVGYRMHRAEGDEFRRGSVFCNLLVADHLNRTSPKTQSALLEAMASGTVTVDGTVHRLPTPFILIATQNPDEDEGTYSLPSAQLDRFDVKTDVGYPDPAVETELVLRGSGLDPQKTPLSRLDILRMKQIASQVHFSPSLARWLVNIAAVTREDNSTKSGISPRCLMSIARLSRARAVSVGRNYVIPDDIKAFACPAMAHRLELNPEAILAGTKPRDVIERSLEVPIPRTS